MNTKGLLIFFGIPVLIVTFLLFINNLAFLGADAIPKGSSLLQSTESTTSQSEAPDDKSFIQMFFETISTGDYNLALAMMDPSNVSTQEDIKAWGNQFASFDRLIFKEAVPSNEGEWKENEHTFKVTVNAKMKAESANASIPYFGWSEGDNVKWVTVVKGEDGLWRVLRIASGM